MEIKAPILGKYYLNAINPSVLADGTDSYADDRDPEEIAAAQGKVHVLKKRNRPDRRGNRSGERTNNPEGVNYGHNPFDPLPTLYPFAVPEIPGQGKVHRKRKGGGQAGKRHKTKS